MNNGGLTRKRLQATIISLLLSLGLLVCILPATVLATNGEGESSWLGEDTSQTEDSSLPQQSGSDEVQSVIETEEEQAAQEESFVFDAQPASAEELAELLAAMEEQYADDYLALMAALPKWEFAIDEDWLPAGWKQAEFEHEATGTVYWRLVPGTVAAAGPLVESDEDVLPAVSYSQITSAITTISNRASKTGTIEVTGTISLTGAITIPAGVNVTVTGGTLISLVQNYSGAYHFIVNGTLTLTNITLEGGGNLGGVRINSNASATLGEGCIIQNCVTTGQVTNGMGGGKGSAVHMVGTGMSLYIQGAVLQNNEAVYSGTVYADVNTGGTALVHMTSGSIKNNTVQDNGGGIYGKPGTTILMEGGDISGNVVYRSNYASNGFGGGIYLDASAANPSYFTMTGGYIQNNEASYGSGAYLQGEYYGKIDGGTIQNNIAVSYTSTKTQGGGILSLIGTLDIISGTISGNEAYYGGGIMPANGTTLNIKGGNITGNTATGNGGGIAAYGLVDEYDDLPVELNISAGTISGNFASSGAGVYAEDSAVKIAGGTISGNTAVWGAGVYAYNSTLSMSNGSITANEAKDLTNNYTPRAGGIFLNNTTGTVSGGNITNNRAEQGAGVNAYLSTLNITGGVVSGNTASDSGGALRGDEAVFNITGGTLSGNSAPYGGFAEGDYETQFTVENATITGNRATQHGGAFYLFEDSTLTLKNATLSDNHSGRDAGAIFAWQLEDVSAENSVFTGNTAGNGTYEITDADDLALHAAQIKGSTFSLPTSFNSTAYNNFDIYYINGAAHFPVYYWWNFEDPDSEYEVEFYTAGAQLVAPNEPQRAGIDFLGWYKDADCTQGWVFESDVMPNAALHLWAGWQELDEYTVTFDAGEGAPTPAAVNVYETRLVPAPTNPQLVGHELLGWYTDPTDEATYWDFDTQPMPGYSFTLYAVYEANYYDVVYDFGYNNKTETRTVQYGTRLTQPTVESRSGYTFGGWKQENGSMWNFNSLMPARSMRLTAVWTATSTSGGGGENPEPSSSSSTTTSRTSSSSAPSSSSSEAPSSSSSSAPVAVASSSSSAPASPAPSEPATGSRDIGADGGRGERGDDDYVQPNGTWNLFGNEVPLGGLASRGGWSAVNLLLALMTLPASIMMGIRVLRRRRGEGDEPTGASRVVLPLVYILAGVLPLVLFFPLEGLGMGMIVVSRWTPLFSAITIAHALLGVIVRRFVPVRKG